jgi:hypothetical protein
MAQTIYNQAIARFQIQAFQAIFNGLMLDSSRECEEAFVQAIALTSDDNIEVVKHRREFRMYMEMLKGNALTKLYYSKEKLGKRGIRQAESSVDMLNSVLDEIK